MHIGRKKFFGKVGWGRFGENKIEMRTVIYVGLLSIADAINNDWCNVQHAGIYATIFICAVFMDMYEFVIKKK